MGDDSVLRAGDKVLVGSTLLTVTDEFARSVSPGDEILGISQTGTLRVIPAATRSLVSNAVASATAAFGALQTCTHEQVTTFFELAAIRLTDASVISRVIAANERDVELARERGRSTTRLELTAKMADDMVAAFRMWRDSSIAREVKVDQIEHVGWVVEQWRSPLGVVAFVFEGRPNVFADATGVLRAGNTVVFRIGSDALGTARALMNDVVTPSLIDAGLPVDSVVLVDSAEHASGWALFSDARVGLAVARGSGSAVAELGAIARQSGINVSLHGTGGAWIIAGAKAPSERLASVVKNSLDRKVCNTVNTVCVVRSRADELVDVVCEAVNAAALARGVSARIHATADAIEASTKLRVNLLGTDTGQHPGSLAGVSEVTNIGNTDLGAEHEWERNPELNIAVVETIDDAVQLFNDVSPQFIVSIVSDDPTERDFVWQRANAPFVGDGFTRWVDGQFALLRPELGLSNWQEGRLLARGGVLSGDSVYTVRLRVRQEDPDLHR